MFAISYFFFCEGGTIYFKNKTKCLALFLTDFGKWNYKTPQEEYLNPSSGIINP